MGFFSGPKKSLRSSRRRAITDIGSGADDAISFLQPFLDESGELRGATQNALLDFILGGNEFSVSPGVEAAIRQGSDRIEDRAAAMGKLNSGGTLRALDELRTDAILGDANNQFRQRLAKFNSLAPFASFGSGPASNIANILFNEGVSRGNVHQGTGNALANTAFKRFDRQKETLGDVGTFFGVL